MQQKQVTSNIVSISLQSFLVSFVDSVSGRLLGLLQRFVVLCLILAAANVANAKDLSQRLGIGYTNQSAAALPSVTVKYFPGAELGLSASLGIDTEKDNSRFGLMAKLYRIIFQEDNLNFYMGAGAGLLSGEVAGNTESGFELMGVGGAEFFLPGLENLGFSFETGVGVTSISSSVRFRTIGDHPIRAGIIFYF